MPKVFIAPTYKHADRAEGGIRRVSEALWKYLPQFGWEPTDKPEEADLLNLHGASWYDRPDVPVVASCHGLYWDDYHWEKWAHETNKQVVQVLTRAQAITAPSEWVAHALRHGLLTPITVAHHGVDADEWGPGENKGYVLWNKARSDAVSDPSEMQALAARMLGTPFVTTIGEPTANVKVAGVVNIKKMRPLIQQAGVYLATARETFGIGTLEALACGVPVVGWDYGGQSEIILHGETGYLAEYGDYAALAECVTQALAERERLSANALADVRARWAWPDKVEIYARLFDAALARWHAPGPKVSVVVTCHDLGKYLPDALKSVQAQTLSDWECLIVDDVSADDSPKVAREFEKSDKRFRYLRTPENLKLSGARNFGFERAQGKYIICLDADDMLAENALLVLATALDREPGLHVAYGHLDTVNEQGEGRQSNPWPPTEFNWFAQVAHLNQLPYAAMVRREVWENVGGYRRRAWRAEDAEAWIRVTSFGYRIAKVTQQPTLVYRFRSDSKSMQERAQYPDGDGDWTAWYPWRLAGNGREGVQVMKRGGRTVPALTPWAAQGLPPEKLRWWPVPHHQRPRVSVIIPVGNGHESLVIDAVESVMAQTYRDWEVIVVNDTGHVWDERWGNPLAGAPYARVIQPKRAKNVKGAGAARNVGLLKARGELVVFLDADDYLLPQFLEKAVAEYEKTGRLIYTDYLVNTGQRGEPLQAMECEDWRCSSFVETDSGPRLDGNLNRMLHAVTCVIPRAVIERAGGFNEQMAGWEDWDFFIRLEAEGLCSMHVPEPLFVYRTAAGARRKASEARSDALRLTLYNQWRDYYRGVKTMASCGSCPGAQPNYEPLPPVNAANELPPQDAVLLEYKGDSVGTLTFSGHATGTLYYFGNTDQHRRKYVRIADAKIFLESPNFHIRGQQLFELVGHPAPVAPTPILASAPEKRSSLPEMQTFMEQAEREATVRGERPKVVLSTPVADLSLDEIKERAAQADENTLAKWLLEERAGENRKAVVRIINKALSKLRDANAQPT